MILNVKNCEIKHTESEEKQFIEASELMWGIINRYYQHDGVACTSCIDNALKLLSILKGKK